RPVRVTKEDVMKWFRTVSMLAVAVGFLLLTAGCTGRDKVAIAAKDDTIRRQEETIAQATTERAKLAEMNKALAAQNEQMATRNAAGVQELRQQVSDLETIMKGIDSQFTRVKPGAGVPNGAAGAYSVGPDGAIHITVASQTFFDSGKADLKTSAH